MKLPLTLEWEAGHPAYTLHSPEKRPPETVSRWFEAVSAPTCCWVQSPVPFPPEIMQLPKKNPQPLFQSKNINSKMAQTKIQEGKSNNLQNSWNEASKKCSKTMKRSAKGLTGKRLQTNLKILCELQRKEEDPGCGLSLIPGCPSRCKIPKGQVFFHILFMPRRPQPSRSENCPRVLVLAPFYQEIPNLFLLHLFCSTWSP